MADSAASRPPDSTSSGKWIIGVLVILLLILHQDNWFWDNGTLVFGFMPIALFYHACISIAAGSVWYAATKIAWPVETIAKTYEQMEEEAAQ